MKLRLLSSIMFASLVSVCGAAAAQETGHKPAASQPAPSAAATDKATSDKTVTGDSLALGLLAAVNEHEIAAAKQAKGKKVSGRVLSYAQMMEKEHGENLTKTKALGALSNGEEVRTLKAKGANEIMALSAASGTTYAKAYIDAMIKGHAQALDMIDARMLPAATSAAVKQHLTDTRVHVAKHLEAAKAIAATL